MNLIVQLLVASLFWEIFNSSNEFSFLFLFQARSAGDQLDVRNGQQKGWDLTSFFSTINAVNRRLDIRRD